MKKKFLLPVFAILLAAGGAFASNRFLPVYYFAGDIECTGEENPDPPCTPGEDIRCVTDDPNETPYSYRPTESSPCQELLKDEQPR